MITTNNKTTKFIFAVCVLSLISLKINAQQDSQYTQYAYNTQTINPAYAGSRGFLSITSLYRTQWTGFDGAPKTINLSANTPLGSSERIGIGVSAFQDAIGPADEINANADVSYTIPLNHSINFSFGIKVGANILNVDYTKLNLEDLSDELQQNNVDNKISPNVGLGVLFVNNNWFAGASIPNLLETNHFDDTTISNAAERPSLYVLGGYVFDLNQNLKFKPSLLTKWSTGAPLAIDLSANFLIKDKFTAGLAYRLDAAVSALAGFQINDKLLIGYAYDYSLQGLQNYNSGSHEVFLRFELKRVNQKERLVTPRFF